MHDMWAVATLEEVDANASEEELGFSFASQWFFSLFLISPSYVYVDETIRFILST